MLFGRSLSTPSQPPPGPGAGSARPAQPAAVGVAAAGQPTNLNSTTVARAARPSFLVLAPTFIFTHFTLAWALVPPIYLVLRTTNLSNTLLAGPQGAWFLSRQVPTWIPDAVVDNLVGGVPVNERKASQRPTVEELLERLARRGIRAAYNISTSAFSAFKKGGGEEDALARAAIRELRGGLGMEKEEVKEKASGYTDKIKGFTRQQAQGAVSEIKFGQVRDAVAAWVLVKVSPFSCRESVSFGMLKPFSSPFRPQILFPVRLPVSLFLTPRVARGLAKFFAK